MTVRSKSYLKAKFENGDRPLQEDFGDLIDSYQNIVSTALTSAGAFGLQMLATETTAQASTLLNIPTVPEFSVIGKQIASAATTAAVHNLLEAGTTGLQIFKTVTTAAVQNILGITAATTAQAGTVRIADQTAMEAETAGRAVTAELMPFSPLMPKAWIRFNGTGTPTAMAGKNVGAITDNGVGHYTVALTVTLSQIGAVTFGWIPTDRTNGYTVALASATSTSISIFAQANSTGAVDLADISMIVWGDI